MTAAERGILGWLIRELEDELVSHATLYRDAAGEDLVSLGTYASDPDKQLGDFAEDAWHAAGNDALTRSELSETYLLLSFRETGEPKAAYSFKVKPP